LTPKPRDAAFARTWPCDAPGDLAVIELEITERIAAAKSRLQFDKSVPRLVNGLKAALAQVVPEGQAVIFTITAPIKRRAKTAAVPETLVRGGRTRVSSWR
jgi:hypothetical protein